MNIVVFSLNISMMNSQKNLGGRRLITSIFPNLLKR